MQMKVPPTLYKLNYLSNRPFATSTISLLHLAIGLETRVRAIGVWTILESSLIPDEDDARLQILLMQESVISSQFFKRGKAVGCGVINRDFIVVQWAVDGEEIVEVNKILTEIELVVDQDRLLRLLFLEHESLYSSLWIYNRLKHNLIFLITREIFHPNKRLVFSMMPCQQTLLQIHSIFYQATPTTLLINLFESLKVLKC